MPQVPDLFPLMYLLFPNLDLRNANFTQPDCVLCYFPLTSWLVGSGRKELAEKSRGSFERCLSPSGHVRNVSQNRGEPASPHSVTLDVDIIVGISLQVCCLRTNLLNLRLQRFEFHLLINSHSFLLMEDRSPRVRERQSCGQSSGLCRLPVS